MTEQEAIRARHAVRSYTDKPIEGEPLARLQQAIADANRESGLHIQLCLDEPRAFSGLMARYGKFTGANNYIALIGPKGSELDEKGGYYGEKLVLAAQCLGLNTCWVALTYSKGKIAAGIAPGEKLLMVVTIGYGTTAGVPHKSKPLETLYQADGAVPDWFRRGMEAAQLAPTAVNQQKFRFTLAGNTVRADAGSGPYAKTDLGIVKYHFEVGAGAETTWHWV